MKKISPVSLSALVLAAAAILPLGSASAAVTWSGAGTDAKWDTLANWSGGAAPLTAETADFGSGFGSGSPDVNGSHSVGGLELTNTSNLKILNSVSGGALTITGPVTRTVTSAASAELATKVILSGTVDTAINAASNAGTELRFSGGVEGDGHMVFTTTGQRSTLTFSSANPLWSGGMTIDSTVTNSRVDVLANGGLGTGDIAFNGNAIVRLTGNVDHTVSNHFTVSGASHFFEIGTSSTNRTIEFTGSIDGAGADSVVFTKPATGTNNTLVLSGSNHGAAGSRMIFYGDPTGGVTRIANNNALDWASVVLGQSNVNGDHVMYFANGISTSAALSLNDDAGTDKDTLFVLGSDLAGANVAINGDILLNKYSTVGYTRLLQVTAASGGTTTFGGKLYDRVTATHLNVEKTGGGKVVFSRATGNDYTGNTTVSQGTLLVNNTSGSGTGIGSVIVKNGAILGGKGIVAPTGSNGFTAESGAVLAPGDGPGTFTLNLASTTGSASFASGASFLFDLSGPGSSDVFAFNGLTNGAARVNFNGNVVNFTNPGDLAAGTYTLFTFNADNAYSGVLALGSGLGGWSGNLIYNANSIQLQVVPEPASLALAGMGIAAAALFGARRRRSRD